MTWLGSFYQSAGSRTSRGWKEASPPLIFRMCCSSATATIFPSDGTGLSREYAYRALEAIVGGWKTNGIWRLADGRPLTFTLADGNSLPTYGGQRPNIVGTPRRNHGPDWVDQYFADINVFQRPDDFTLGTAPRALGGIRCPLSFTADLSMGKQFSMARVGEDMNLEVSHRGPECVQSSRIRHAKHFCGRSQLWTDHRFVSGTARAAVGD